MKVLVLVLLFASFVLAQSQAPAPQTSEKAKEMDEKAVQMLEQVIADAPTLMMAHNRAIVYAIAGDLYWKFDEKRARELFRSCMGEIITANADWEKEQSANEGFNVSFNFSNLRNETLPLVAKHDAEMALQMLIQTRPAALAEAMARADAAGSKAAQPDGFSQTRYAVQRELYLEQQFASLAADSDPDKAIKLLRDSLARGISPNALDLLQKINRKDEKKARDLAGEIVSKIVDTDLTKKPDDLNAAIGMLQIAAAPPAAGNNPGSRYRFSDALARDIAGKLVATFMQPGLSSSMLLTMNRAISTIEKILPEKAAALRARQAETSRTLPAEFKRIQQSQKMWDPNTTPEDIIAQLPKLNESERNNANMILVDKIARVDDEARAKRLISAIGDDKVRDRANEALESAKVSRALRDGKIEDARRMVTGLGQKKTQIQMLVALAADSYRRGGDKNIETAGSLMKDAKSLINEFPEDGDELTQLLDVVRGYTIIEPDEGFRLFDPVIDQINDVVQATAVLSKYNKRITSFKKGELVFRVNSYTGDDVILFRCIPQIQALGKADIEKASQMTDRLVRPDARIIAKLYVLQGFLRASPVASGGIMGAPIIVN